VNGIVQGVGFRPFIFQLANQHKIKGAVANTSSGVSIHIEGSRQNVESFCRGISENKPPLALITQISLYDEPVNDFKDFTIADSRGQTMMATLISPDVSVCHDCRRELFDPEDHRFQYPFINCTNCGPRYTIIDDIPYDRPKTSMKHFKMCPVCQAEYDDPASRRFHAQPNACKDCGPHVSLYDNARKKLTDTNPIKKSATL